MTDDSLAQVRAAVAGDDASIDWLVDRYTPWLLAQARARIGPELRRVVDADDLVQEVWAIALPRLRLFADRPGFDGRMLLAFLARIQLYRCNDLVRRHIVGKPRRANATELALSRLPGRHSGAVTRAVRAEVHTAVHAAIDRLDADDRRLVVLRGIEQHPVHEIAALLQISDNLVSVRYRRALERLRAAIPAFAFDLAEG